MSAAGPACSPASRSGEMYASVPGHVADRGQRLLRLDLREPEVEEPDGDARSPSASRTFEGFTSRWTIPLRVRVREAVEHLRRRLERGRVVQPAAAHRVAHRLAGHVLVGDVDVALVALRASRRAGSARAAAARPRTASRSAREPALPSRGTILSATSSPVRSSRASQTEPEPAAAERADRAVAVEDELSRRDRAADVRRSTPRSVRPRPVGVLFPADALRAAG